MKKLYLTALLFFSVGACFALPLGNPSDASLLSNGVFFGSSCSDFQVPSGCFCDTLSFRAGYYGDFVFNRHLRLDSNGFGTGRHIKKTEITTNAAYLALNICNRFDLFSTFGATQIDLEANQDAWTTSVMFLSVSPLSRIRWDHSFSWSIGGRGTLFECSGFALGIEGQYFQTRPNLSNYYSAEPTGGGYVYFDGVRMRYSEWQVGAGISYAFCKYDYSLQAVPYIGVKASGAKFHTNNFQFTGLLTGDLVTPANFTLFELVGAKRCGFAAGLTVAWQDMFDVNVEGRWGDEIAFAVNGQLRF